MAKRQLVTPRWEGQKRLLELGVTGLELARITGVSAVAANGWLKGRCKPQHAKRHLIVKHYPQVTPDTWGKQADQETISVAPPKPKPVQISNGGDSELDEMQFPIGSAKRAAYEQLERIREWRAQAESLSDFDQLVKLAPIEARAIKDLAQFSGELSPTDEDKLTRTAKWQELENVLLEALKPHPKALTDVLAALKRFDGYGR